jgi:iron complex outermembrane recepter protein
MLFAHRPPGNDKGCGPGRLKDHSEGVVWAVARIGAVGVHSGSLKMKPTIFSGLARPLLMSTVAFGSLAIATPVFAADADEAESATSEIVVTARKRSESVQSVPIVINAFTAEDLAKRNINSLADLAHSTPGVAINSIAGGNTQTIYIRGLAPANTANDLNVEANVGVFIDGIYQTSRNTLDILSVLDVGQIEIAKGPQSALFGRSTFAGAMAISTGQPADTLSGSLTATAGVDNDLRAKGSISMPLGEAIKFRIGAGYSSYDGWGENSAAPNDNLGGYEKYAFSGAIEIKPSDSFRAVLSGFVTHSLAELSPAYLLAPGQLNCGTTNAATALPVLYCGLVAPRKVSDLSPNMPDTLNKNRQISLLLEGRLGGVKVTSITGLTGSDNRGYSDYDLTSAGVQLGVCQVGNTTNAACGATNFGLAPYTRLARANLSVATVERVRTFSQEIRLQSDNQSPLSWIFGGYFFNSRIPLAASGLGADGLPATERYVQVNQLATPAATGVGPYEFTANIFQTASANGAQVFGSYSASYTKTLSVFGAIGYDFGRLRVNAEGRYNSDVKQAQVFAAPANAVSAPGINRPITGTDLPAAGVFPNAGSLFRKTFNSFSPRITVDYRPTDEIMVYASAAKGVRSGGFNTANAVSATGILASEVPYKEESNWTYEAGVKSRLFNRRLTLNAAFFHTDWKDAQVSAFTQNPTALNPVRIVQNAGSITATGVEAQAEVQLSDIFAFGGSFIYSDPKFKKGSYDGSQITQCRIGTVAPNYTSATGCPPIIAVTTASGATLYVPSLEGLRTQRSVKMQWNLHATVDVPLTGDWKVSARADVNHSGSAFNNLINTVQFGERTLTNARLTVENGRYSVAVWGTNIFNVAYVQNSINQPRAGYPSAFSLPEVYLGEGRRFGVTAGVKF